ncbi:hypothetical protein PVK06_011575 [Gossypium arboreum]|uniref:Uncharacterized protein n=1 Tax=Gossypium arboreum TaxID=29729 RepID=A0ABR0Q9I1_GOSAR|nr:hypothetical protein PVK06_011575 [Gossypium arboreum]
MKRFIVGGKVDIYFPHLVIDLCCRAGVDIASTKQTQCPTRSIINDSLLQKFHSIEWNQQSKKQMDALQAVKKSSVQRRLREELIDHSSKE